MQSLVLTRMQFHTSGRAALTVIQTPQMLETLRCLSQALAARLSLCLSHCCCQKRPSLAFTSLLSQPYVLYLTTVQNTSFLDLILDRPSGPCWDVHLFAQAWGPRSRTRAATPGGPPTRGGCGCRTSSEPYPSQIAFCNVDYYLIVLGVQLTRLIIGEKGWSHD